MSLPGDHQQQGDQQQQIGRQQSAEGTKSVQQVDLLPVGGERGGDIVPALGEQRGANDVAQPHPPVVNLAFHRPVHPAGLTAAGQHDAKAEQ